MNDATALPQDPKTASHPAVTTPTARTTGNSQRSGLASSAAAWIPVR
ncbi:hypothetical protein [Mycolicibacterium elephantis]|nr:hypothetical protein [Mycolicibacterium elephantis]MCV7219711.1 hypothetical protein [Mycolicibacterium elephantis]